MHKIYFCSSTRPLRGDTVKSVLPLDRQPSTSLFSFLALDPPAHFHAPPARRYWVPLEYISAVKHNILQHLPVFRMWEASAREESCAALLCPPILHRFFSLYFLGAIIHPLIPWMSSLCCALCWRLLLKSLRQVLGSRS